MLYSCTIQYGVSIIYVHTANVMVKFQLLLGFAQHRSVVHADCKQDFKVLIGAVVVVVDMGIVHHLNAGVETADDVADSCSNITGDV